MILFLTKLARDCAWAGRFDTQRSPTRRTRVDFTGFPPDLGPRDLYILWLNLSWSFLPSLSSLNPKCCPLGPIFPTGSRFRPGKYLVWHISILFGDTHLALPSMRVLTQGSGLSLSPCLSCTLSWRTRKAGTLLRSMSFFKVQLYSTSGRREGYSTFKNIILYHLNRSSKSLFDVQAPAQHGRYGIIYQSLAIK